MADYCSVNWQQRRKHIYAWSLKTVKIRLLHTIQPDHNQNLSTFSLLYHLLSHRLILYFPHMPDWYRLPRFSGKQTHFYLCLTHKLAVIFCQIGKNCDINIASVLSQTANVFASVWKVRFQSDNVGHSDCSLPTVPGYCIFEHIYVHTESTFFVYVLTVLLTSEQQSLPGLPLSYSFFNICDPPLSW